MPKVTKFNYSLDHGAIKKIDAGLGRLKREKDYVLIFEGKEGTGKTTYSIACAYYMAEKTGRYFGADRVYFDVEELMEEYQNTEDGIFIWDEPALQMLRRDRNDTVANIMRLLMMARKKRHILLINIAHFNKFNDYVIADRPHGMFHVYETKGKQIRALYIKEKNLRKLWDDWERKHKKSYFKFASPLLGSKGKHCFPPVLDPKYKFNVLEDFDFALYDERKNNAINMIGKKKVTQSQKDYMAFRKRIGSLKPDDFPIKSISQFCEKIKLSRPAFYEWASLNTEKATNMAISV